MDRKKLNKAADILAGDTYDAESRLCFIDGVVACADWLMQQPLSERLSEEEKEKINKLQGEIFKEIMDAHDAEDWQSVAHYILDVMPRTFANIFGADLF